MRFLPFILLCQLAAAQTPVLDFVNAKAGKKVGNGDCLSFVIEAESKQYQNWYKNYFMQPDSMQARRVNLEDMLPGDVIMFEGVVMSDSSSIDQHIGIVTKVDGDVIVYASQNLGRHGDKEISRKHHGVKAKVFKSSCVVFSEFDYGKWIDGNTLIYRF